MGALYSYGHISLIDLSKLLQTGSRLEECSLAPKSVNILLQHCWLGEPSQRQHFEDFVYTWIMNMVDKRSYEARSDSEEYVEMSMDLTENPTPSNGTTSKSSTRSWAI